MAPVPFDELGEAGRARRLRPLAIASLRAWDLDVERVRLVTNGYNAIFRVDAAEGAYALRVNLPRRSDAELRAELAWLRALSMDGAVRVGEPVPTREGAGWARARADGVPGSRRCVLFRWVGGRTLRTDDHPALFERFGEATAALHEHARGWRTPRGLLRLTSPFPYPDQPPILFDQALSPRVRAIYERALAATEEALRLDADRPIVVHHDLHPDNVRVRRDELWVLDFDDCAVATPAQDLGTGLFQMRMLGCPRDRLDAFRRGYERSRTWPGDQLVAAFVAGAALELGNAVYQDFDPGYRAVAGEYAARWARVAADALRDR